ncbi:PspC domain-containing protein [Thermoanaerobacter ethanolicus]
MVRLIWAFATLFWGTGLIVHLVAWWISPEEPQNTE